jgi:hypothetical protein
LSSKDAGPPEGVDQIDDRIAHAYFQAELHFLGREEPADVPHFMGELYVEANKLQLSFGLR